MIMFWQIIKTDQLHKASQLFVHYLEHISNKQEIRQLTNWDRGTNAQMNPPTYTSSESDKHLRNTELLFPFTSASATLSRAYAVFPYKPSHFPRELQQMRWEPGGEPMAGASCPVWLVMTQILKFCALAVQETDTQLFVCEVRLKRSGGQLPA